MSVMVTIGFQWTNVDARSQVLQPSSLVHPGKTAAALMCSVIKVNNHTPGKQAASTQLFPLGVMMLRRVVYSAWPGII
jgi:hypothetical protein